MASTVAELVQKLDKAAVGIDRAQRDAVIAVSMMAKSVMMAGAASVDTPRTINTRRGRRGNAWGVRFNEFTSRQVPLTTVFYWGAPAYWRERGIGAHTISPGRGRRALWFGGNEFAATVEHPGVSARPFWSPTKATVQARSGEIYRKANVAAMVRAGFNT